MSQNYVNLVRKNQEHKKYTYFNKFIIPLVTNTSSYQILDK